MPRYVLGNSLSGTPHWYRTPPLVFEPWLHGNECFVLTLSRFHASWRWPYNPVAANQTLWPRRAAQPNTQNATVAFAGADLLMPGVADRVLNERDGCLNESPGMWAVHVASSATTFCPPWCFVRSKPPRSVTASSGRFPGVYPVREAKKPSRPYPLVGMAEIPPF